MMRILKAGGILVVVALLLVSGAQAQTNFWWTNTVGGAWNDANNWTNSLPASSGGANYTISFVNAGNAYDTTNDFGDFMLNQLAFDNTAVSLYGSNLIFVADGSLNPQVVQTGASNVVIYANIAQNSNTTYSVSSQLTLNGTISGSSRLIKTGSGTLTLGVANTFNGGVIVSNGVVRTGNAAALGVTAPSGTQAVVLANAAIDLAGNTNSGYTGLIVINGMGVATNFGAIGNSGAALTWTGVRNIALAGNSAIGSDGNRFDISGTLYGNGYTLTKVGNDYIAIQTVTNLAALVISNGTWSAESANAIARAPVTTVSQGVLQLVGNIAFTNSLTMYGGTLKNYNGTNAWNGPITLMNGTTNTIDVGANAGGIMYIGGHITGTGVVQKIGAYTLILTNSNTYIGQTIFGGTGTTILSNVTGAVVVPGNLQIGSLANNNCYVYLGGNEQIADSAILTFVGGSGQYGRWMLMGFNETIGGLLDPTGTNGLVQVSENANWETNAGPSRLTINISTNLVYGGYLRDYRNAGPSNRLSLVVTGTGTQTLAGGNISFTGGTWVKGSSTLVLSNTAANSSIITNDATLMFAGSQTRTLLITGTGVVMRAGGDGGETILRGTNTYTGGTVINGGRINLDTAGSSNVFGRGSITVTNVGQLFLTAANTITNALFVAGQGYPDINGRIGALRLEGNSVLAGPVTLVGNTRIGNNGGVGFINGNITGSYGLEFYAYPGSAGTIVLGGTNTHGGPTTITNGINVSVSRVADTGVSGIGFGNLVFGNGTLSYTGPGASTTARGISITTVGTFNITNTAGVLTLSGAIDGAGSLTKAGSGTLQLEGANTYVGGTTINAGLLQFNNTNAIPTTGFVLVNAGGVVAGSFANLTNNLLPRVAVNSVGLLGLLALNAAENIDFNTGGFTNLGLGAVVTMTYGGVYTPYQQGGTNYYRLGAVTGATLTYTNQLVNGASGGALTINQGGAGGRVILTTNNTYSGPTAINGGTLTPTVLNVLPTNTALSIGDSTGAGALDLSNFSQTVGRLTFTSTNAGLTNTVTIGAGQTLNLTGAFTNGNSAASGASTITKISGPGSFMVTNIGGSFTVGGSNSSTATYIATLDMSGLSVFNANLSNGTFRVSFVGAGSGNGTLTASLATNSVIRAGTLGINDNSDKTAGLGILNLGAGTNALYANSIFVGGGKNNSTLQFGSSAGVLTISNNAGTGRANLTVGVNAGGLGTGSSQAGIFDVRGHNAALYLGGVTNGGRVAGSSGNGAGYIYFDRGVVDVNNMLIGTRTGTSSGSVTGEVHIGGGVANFGLIQLAQNTSPSNNAVVALLNFYGGTNTLGGDITKVGGVGAAVATLILSNNAVLDMGGHNIGDGTNSIDNLIFQGGTLKNVAEINGGDVYSVDLVKTGSGTLILDGVNTYTGLTTINGGLLQFNNPSAFPLLNYIALNAGGALAGNFANLTDNLLVNLTTDSAGMVALLATNVGESFDFNSIAFTAYPNLILGAATNLTYGGTYTPYEDGDGIKYYRFGALSGATFTFTNVISDAATGAVLRINEGGFGGTVVLTASNTYSGSTVVNAGILVISNASGLGTAAGGTLVASNAQLQISGGVTINEPITINNDSQFSWTGALRSTGGTNTWSGLITLGSSSRIRVDAGGRLYVTGGVTNLVGNNMFVANSISTGSIVFTNNPMYLGNSGTLLVHDGNTTFVVAGNTLGSIAVQYNGTLTLGVDNPFPAFTALTLGDAATNTGTLNLNGYNQTFGSIATLGLKSTNTVITSATPATLTISNSTPNTYDGRLTGALSLTKDGTNTLTLTKNILTYTGDTTIMSGTLALGSGAVVSNTARFVLQPGAFLDVNGMGGLTLAPGQELKGSGTVLGSVTAGANTFITPGNSVGTLTVGNLTLTNGVKLNFELGATNASDLVVVSNMLSLGGMNTNWFVLSAVEGFGEGTYTLFDAAGITGSLGSATNFASINGYTGYLWLDDANKDVKLTVVPEPGTGTLVGAGLLAMFLLRRWRRQEG